MNATIQWYENVGFLLFNKWLTELRAKQQKTIYIDNFEFLPKNADKASLVKVLNEDAGYSWDFRIDNDGYICAEQKY